MTPVPGLRNVPLVAELDHQLVTRFCVLSKRETSFGDTLAETIVW